MMSCGHVAVGYLYLINNLNTHYQHSYLINHVSAMAMLVVVN